MRETAMLMAKRSPAVRDMYRRCKHAYVHILSVVVDDAIDSVSEFSPDHSKFDETVFRESVLVPAEENSGLSMGSADIALAARRE